MARVLRPNYEQDSATFAADYYSVRQYPGVAFYVLGWETEPDEDTEWSGYETRTGNVLAVMVGDDYRHRVDPDDLTPLASSEFCRDCGQIGCGHNVVDEDEDPPKPECSRHGTRYRPSCQECQAVLICSL